MHKVACDEDASHHPLISALHPADRGARKQGGGVIEAFYEGFSKIQSKPWEYIFKLHSDLSFSADYFASCLARFLSDSKLGIGGGLICCCEVEDELCCESPGDPAFQVRSATKMYRRACSEAIGGLLKSLGCDTISELKANMLSWTTGSFRDVALKDHRFTGSPDGTWKNYVKFGFSNYITGYHPIFMTPKCLKRLADPLFLIGSAGLFWGGSKGYLCRVEPVNDSQLIE